MGARLPRFGIQVEVNPDEFMVKGRDDDDAVARFHEKVRRHPEIILDVLEIVTTRQLDRDEEDNLEEV